MWQHLSIEQLHQLQQHDDITVVDVRDLNSFQNGHIQGAQSLNANNMQEFIQASNHQQCCVVCCYHGNSSQMVAQFLVEQGFTNVYSLDGGYAAWVEQYPDLCS